MIHRLPAFKADQLQLEAHQIPYGRVRFYSYANSFIGYNVSVHVPQLKLSELRPGMENVELIVELISLEEPRKVTTYSGLEHTLVEGLVKDGSGSMKLTVWNEKIEELEGIEAGDTLKLVDCFVTSFKGELSVNVGRDSGIQRQ